MSGHADEGRLGESLVMDAAPDAVAVWVLPWWRAMRAAHASIRAYGWERGWSEGSVRRDFREAGKSVRALADRLGHRWPAGAQHWVRAVQSEGRMRFRALLRKEGRS